MAALTKIVLIIEYDGTRYNGFQLQAEAPTIQGEMEKALSKLTGAKTRVLAASRTDTGVHALGQVVSFRTSAAHSPDTFVRALNYHLPKDIAVREAHRVPDSLNVQKSAVSREYSYYILNRATRSAIKRAFAYHFAARLDVDSMNSACQSLIGEHDLASFASSMSGSRVRSTVRHTYRAQVSRDGELVTFNVVARSFLPHQVRNTVGSLLRIGTGRLTLDGFQAIIDARRPGLAGPAAPPCGLCLLRVNYATPFGDEIP